MQEKGKDDLLSLVEQSIHVYSSESKCFLGRRGVPMISTSSLNLDIALGIGGFPKERMVQMYELETSGKITLGLHTIAEPPKE